MKKRDPEFHDALTLRGLHERLGQIIAENERRWPERNDLPVVVKVDQADTDGGRRRDCAYLPIEFGESAMLSMRAGTKEVHVVQLHSAPGVAYVKGERAAKVIVSKASDQ